MKKKTEIKNKGQTIKMKKTKKNMWKVEQNIKKVKNRINKKNSITKIIKTNKEKNGKKWK